MWLPLLCVNPHPLPSLSLLDSPGPLQRWRTHVDRSGQQWKQRGGAERADGRTGGAMKGKHRAVEPHGDLDSLRGCCEVRRKMEEKERKKKWNAGSWGRVGADGDEMEKDEENR